MKKLFKLSAGAAISVLALAAAMPAQAASISGSQITVSSTIPGGSSRFTLNQINDGIKSDASPFNGFQGRNRTTGTLTFDLDQSYRLTALKLWNDINVREESVKDMRLEFIDASGNTLGTRNFTTTPGITGVQTLNFPAVNNVKKVNMHVLSFHPGRGIVRTEIREVEFEGEPASAVGTGRPNRDLEDLAGKLQAECTPCFGNSLSTTLGGVVDNFAGGNSETTSPRAGFNNITSITGYKSNRPGITRDYDETHANEFFIDSMNIPNAAQIQKGWIVFRAKDRGGLVTTDSIYMGDVLGHFQEDQDAKLASRSRDDIHARVFGKKYTDFKSQLNVYGQSVFKFDSATGLVWANLADVELISKSHKGTTSLLEQIKADGQMDFLIQDDTGIDFFAILACVPREGGKTHVENGEGPQSGGRPPSDLERINELRERFKKRKNRR